MLHIAMGLIVFVVEESSKIFFLVGIIYFLYRVFSNGNRRDEVLLGAAYVTGFEVFSRMTGGAISYEFAKYMVIIFLVIGMFFKGFTTKSWPYVIFILFLIPGIFVASISLNYEAKFGNAIGFNLSGPLCLAISALYCYDRRISMKRFQGILLALLLPIIATTVYLYLYTPNIRDVLTNTASNFAASGGFGPNQVATILGLGVLILFSRFILIRNTFINIIDISLLGLVGYRAIVTFSRGGVITGVVCVLLLLATYLIQSKGKDRVSIVPKILVASAVVVFTWVITSIATVGFIDKRYANQDAAGREKEDLTTGRSELVSTELQAFYENPIVGIGVGKMKEYRLEETGRLSATHNEVSRTLSEHGILGISALLILIITPLVFRIKNKSNLYLYTFLVFWFLTINHSSMRIAAPAFIYGLGLITIIHVTRKTIIHRK